MLNTTTHADMGTSAHTRNDNAQPRSKPTLLQSLGNCVLRTVHAVALSIQKTAPLLLVFHCSFHSKHNRHWRTPMPKLNITSAEYHANPALGSSGIRLLRQRPSLFKCHVLDGVTEQKRCFDLGTAFHAAVLEPDAFAKNYTVPVCVMVYCAMPKHSIMICFAAKEIIKK